MKGKKKVIAGILLVMLMTFTQWSWVCAAEPVTVSVKADNVSEGDTEVTVKVVMDQDQKVTNGKLRVRYDAEALKLQESSAGNELSGMMTNINDCLNGNKEEGELVFVFASAQAIETKGTLLELVFVLDERVKNGDEISVSVDVEEFGTDGEDVETEVENLKIVVGKKNEVEQNISDGSDEEHKTVQTSTDQTGTSGSGPDTGTKVKTGDEMSMILWPGLTAAAFLICTERIIKRKKGVK